MEKIDPTKDRFVKMMEKYKALSDTQKNEMRLGLNREQRKTLNEMNKRYGSILADQRKAAKKYGGGGGGTPTQFGASGKRGAEKMRKNPFDLNKGGKVKFSRGGGVATQGTKFSKDG